MAVMINGARVDEQVYEFGVVIDGLMTTCRSYDEAVALSKTAFHRESRELKMRCVYKTEWMDAK